MKQLCMMLAAMVVATGPAPAFAHHQSMVSTGSAQRPATTVEQNKALARAFVEEVFNQRNPAAADKYLAKTFVDHAPWPGQKGDLAGFKAGLGAYLKAVPGATTTVKQIVAEGDKVFILMTMANQDVTIDSYDLVRIQNGKLVEHWGVADRPQAAAGHDHDHGHDHGPDGHQH